MNKTLTLSFVILVGSNAFFNPQAHADTSKLTTQEILKERERLGKISYSQADFRGYEISSLADGETGIFWSGRFVGEAAGSSFALYSISDSEPAMSISPPSWDEEEQVYRARGTVQIEDVSGGCPNTWNHEADFTIHVMPKSSSAWSGAYRAMEIKTYAYRLDSNCKPVANSRHEVTGMESRFFGVVDWEAVMKMAQHKWRGVSAKADQRAAKAEAALSRAELHIRGMEQKIKNNVANAEALKQSVSSLKGHIQATRDYIAAEKDFAGFIKTSIQEILTICATGSGNYGDTRFTDVDRKGELPNSLVSESNAIWQLIKEDNIVPQKVVDTAERIARDAIKANI